MQANPGLTKLLRETCGEVVLDDPTAIVRLAAHAGDAGLQQRITAVKRANKVALSRLIEERVLGHPVDPDALFDVQIKRIHEYKRQLLNLLETVALYLAIRAEPNKSWVPRVKISLARRRRATRRRSSSSSWPTISRRSSTTTRRFASSCRWSSCRTTMSAWQR